MALFSLSFSSFSRFVSQISRIFRTERATIKHDKRSNFGPLFRVSSWLLYRNIFLCTFLQRNRKRERANALFASYPPWRVYTYFFFTFINIYMCMCVECVRFGKNERWRRCFGVDGALAAVPESHSIKVEYIWLGSFFSSRFFFSFFFCVFFFFVLVSFFLYFGRAPNCKINTYT